MGDSGSKEEYFDAKNGEEDQESTSSEVENPESDDDDDIFSPNYATKVDISETTDKLYNILEKNVSKDMLNGVNKIFETLANSHKVELFEMGVLNRVCKIFNEYFVQISPTRYVPNSSVLYTDHTHMKLSSSVPSTSAASNIEVYAGDEIPILFTQIFKQFLFGNKPKHYQENLSKNAGIVEEIAESQLFNFIEEEFRNNQAKNINMRLEFYNALLDLTNCFSLCPEFTPYLFQLKDSRSIASIFSEFCVTLNNYLSLAVDKKSVDTNLISFIHQADDLFMKFRQLSSKNDELLPAKKIKLTQNFSKSTTTNDDSSKIYAESLRLYQIQSVDLTESPFSYRNELKNSEDPHSVAATSRTTRIAKEISTLYHSLPLSASGSIFLCIDDSRSDVLKALISGPGDTPYSNGLFEFDIYFPNSYPNDPPKCSIVTTDGGRVRFNPNLYSCGKVCLSILNTWSGSVEEQWSPLKNILQVLVSIQSLVMVKEPYCNEPGLARERNTEASRQYSIEVEYANLVYAIHKQYKSTSPYFKKVMKLHFWIKRQEIIEQARKWIEKYKRLNSNEETRPGYPVFENSCETNKVENVERLIEDFSKMENNS